ncbi:MAG: flagellar hook-length control protein FliK [Steroidobacteraceae bacterium]
MLTQSLASDPKASASNAAPTGGSSTPATPATPAGTAAPAATAGTAATALTAAAQLPSLSHVGSQPATANSSTMALAAQVGTSAWTDELGTKLTWMASQGIQSASLQLSPEHLGPLQVNISVHDGQASVWFGAAQSDTRTALQQSLPQLRQLFANQGLALADAGVSREPPRGQDRRSRARSASSVSAVTPVNLDSANSPTSIEGGLGLVDTYV